MSIPVWTLLGFAGWTIAMLIATVGVYRWSRILSGRAAIDEYRTPSVEGQTRFYARAMRAHANCVENLPVYAAVVLALEAAGVRDPVVDVLALVVIGARVIHTAIHVSVTQTSPVVSVRFTFFAIQIVCMIAMGAYAVAEAI